MAVVLAAGGAVLIAVGTVAMDRGSAAHAYAVTGFLKGFHAVTLHAVLVLPALAWLLARGSWPEARRVRVVAAAVAAYVIAAGAVLVWELVAV